MKIRCQNCGAIYKVPQTMSGKKVQCKKCDTTFVCPAVTATPVFESENQNLPLAFARPNTTNTKRKTETDEAREAREDAILNEHMSHRSKRQVRRQQRYANAIEENRTFKSVVYVGCGVFAMIISIVLGFLLWSMPASPWENRSFRPSYRRILTILYFTGGKYWAPPLLFLFGLGLVVLGVLSYTRKINLRPGGYWDLVHEYFYDRWWPL